MSGRAREKLRSDVKRARIRSLLESGLSLSKIAKETGYSYAVVKLLAGQEKQRGE